MTEIREDGFSLDLPGDWQQADADEPGAYVYREAERGDFVKVMLLSVRPMFTIADKLRLVADYASHRAQFETGQRPGLVQFQVFTEERDGEVEAYWGAQDSASNYRQQHRAVLARDIMADVCYGSDEPIQADFDERAERILETVRVTAE